MMVAMDEKGGIGKNGSIPWDCPEDLRRFARITTGNCRNMLIMGRKTWDSIPEDRRPLRHRMNVVLTRDRNILNAGENNRSNVQFVSDPILAEQYAQVLHYGTVFVIGGKSVYEQYLPLVDVIHVTRIKGDHGCDTFFPADVPSHEVESSDEIPSDPNILSFETWKMVHRIPSAHDLEYFRVLRYVLTDGKDRPDRTGTGVLSVFAPEIMRFDISQSVPLLTTKKMAWKGIIKELLWFLRGDTDAKILQKEGVRIWDGNSSREFLDRRGLHYEEGVIGPAYGWSFRRFGAKYDETFADARNISEEDAVDLGGADQLAYVEKLLKTDPYSRRIYMNLWNAQALDEMALPPCHVGINFYVDKENDATASTPYMLSCQVYIRSNDLFLGNPYNIFSYAVFVYIMAKRCDMRPKSLNIVIGDAHIYKDHIKAVREQLSRKPYAAPKLRLSDNIKNADYADFSIDDFAVDDYVCHPTIRANMSV